MRIFDLFSFSCFLVYLDKETKAFTLVYVEITKDVEYSDNGGFSRLIYTHIYRHIDVIRDKIKALVMQKEMYFLFFCEYFLNTLLREDSIWILGVFNYN